MYSHIIQQIKSFFPNQAFIPLHEPRFTGNDKAYVMDAIDSTYVSSVGKYVDQFEAMMRDYTGAKYAIACVNGTAALHMSLILAGVKRDELVLTQAVSFIATCNAISYIGAEPVFIDIDKSSLGLSPAALLKQTLKLKMGNAYISLQANA
jgi:perosamine synthetase